MTAKHHRLYLDSTIALARTLVVKSEYSAEQINNQVALRFGTNAVNPLNKSTWKYYLNVSGEYHPTDTVIKVKSLDTMQEIDFTKENLVTNTATARGYMPGTRYYRELLTKYPDQALLINGILFPVDINEAIKAEDFTVLSYPPALVESNEEDLITNINAWLQVQRKRWYVNEFNITDEHYCASFLLVMYQQLVPLIMTLRRKACKTFQAHSYHVRQYLISHGMLDAYIDQLTQKQRMFFYRNIRYIHRHAGKEDTFQWLTQNVLTERGMPLAQYEAYHKTTDMPEQLVPTVKFRARSLTSIAPPVREDASTETILAKEITLAPGNAEEAMFSRGFIQDSFAYTELGFQPTKVLESSTIQESTGFARNVQDAALNFWAYAASTGRYSSYVFVTDPATGAELSMPALVAYHYFAYAFYKAHNLSLDVVPPVVATQVPKWPGTSFEDLLKLVNTNDVDESIIYGIWNNHPAQLTFPNTDSFYESVQVLLDAQTTQSLFVSLPESFMGRGMAQAVYDALYPTYVYENATTGSSIKEYFAPYELVVDGLEPSQWQQLYLSLFTAATGQSLTSVQAKTEIQETMVKIMARLSSYSIQFVSDITSTEMQSVSWQSMRFGPGINSGRLYYWLVLSSLDALQKDVQASPRYKVELQNVFNRFSMRVPNRVTEDVAVGFDVLGFVNNTLNAEALMAFDGVRMMYDQIPSVGYIAKYEDLPNMDGYAGYTDQQLSAMPDVYSYKCKLYPLVPSKIDLEDKFNTFNLPVFKALDIRNTQLHAFQSYCVSGTLRYYRNEVFVVVLDGFESNVGDLTVEALKPTFGRNLLNMFTYIPDFAAPQLDSFWFTGLSMKLGTIKPGSSTTDLVAMSFIGSTPQVNAEFIFKNPLPEIMVNYRQATSKLEFGFSQMPSSVDFGLTSEIRAITVNLMKTSKPSIVLNVAQALRNLQLSNFTTSIRTITAPTMSNNFRAYAIPTFRQTFIAQGPVLLSYGIQILDNLEQVDPTEVVDSNIALEFTPVSKVISGEELQIQNATKVLSGAELDFGSTAKAISGPELDFGSTNLVIDIPDFEDLYNQP